jgi:Spy/CpxP family protein refolding chaperone
MTELKTSLKASIKPKREELKTHRKALGELLTSDKIDRSAVQSEQDKINALSNDLANSMLAFRIDFNENLTADQRKQMKEMRASWGEKKHGRGHHHGKS